MDNTGSAILIVGVLAVQSYLKIHGMLTGWWAFGGFALILLGLLTWVKLDSNINDKKKRLELRKLELEVEKLSAEIRK